MVKSKFASLCSKPSFSIGTFVINVLNFICNVYVHRSYLLLNIYIYQHETALFMLTFFYWQTH